MENLYGFQKTDAIKLIEFLKGKKGESLSSLFEKYALSCGKAKGTIRNLYYTISRLSLTSKEFCDEYLEGKTIEVAEKVEFLPCQERALLKQILMAKGRGVSVRRAVKELALGEEKLALRYQNKYRSLIKSKKELALKIIEEIKGENADFSVTLERKREGQFNQFQVNRLRREINALFERTFIELRKENQDLKEENALLRKQNGEIKSALSEKGMTKSVELYFCRGEEEGMGS